MSDRLEESILVLRAEVPVTVRAAYVGERLRLPQSRERIASTPALYSIGAGKHVVLFRYGVIVFFDTLIGEPAAIRPASNWTTSSSCLEILSMNFSAFRSL